MKEDMVEEYAENKSDLSKRRLSWAYARRIAVTTIRRTVVNLEVHHRRIQRTMNVVLREVRFIELNPKRTTSCRVVTLILDFSRRLLRYDVMMIAEVNLILLVSQLVTFTVTADQAYAHNSQLD